MRPDTTNPAVAGLEGMFDIRRLERNDERASVIKSESIPCTKSVQAVRTNYVQSPEPERWPSRRTKLRGRKVPARHESLNCWPPFDSRGDQNRVSGHVGLESAYQGWHPIRTVAQQQGNKNQRSAAWGVPKAVIRRALPKIGEML